MLTAFKKFIQKKKSAIKTWSVPACITAALTVTTPLAMAAPKPEAIISSLLNTIFDIAGYIGVLLLAWGIITLVLAIRNEDADSKSRAVMFIVVAIALICLGALFGPVMKLLGYTIS